MIDKIDGDYINVLVAIGITEEEIEKANITKYYEPIARKLQIIFTKDVIQNSSRNAIRMSNRMSMLMHKLRDINNERIVKYVVLKEDHAIYPKAIKSLMNRFQDVMRDNKIIEKLRNGGISQEDAEDLMDKYEGTPYEDFAKYIIQLTPEDCHFTEDMLYTATQRNIENEQKIARDIVLGKEEFLPIEGYEDKAARIQLYIEYYRSIGLTEDYSQEEIAQSVHDEVVRQLIKGDAKGPTINEKIELEYGIRYISTLNDIEFFNLLKNFDMISEEQEKSLRRTYREIGIKGLQDESQAPKSFDKMVKEQKEDMKKLAENHAREQQKDMNNQR